MFWVRICAPGFRRLLTSMLPDCDICIPSSVACYSDFFHNTIQYIVSWNFLKVEKRVKS
jgi:hypothetical protein